MTFVISIIALVAAIVATIGWVKYFRLCNAVKQNRSRWRQRVIEDTDSRLTAALSGLFPEPDAFTVRLCGNDDRKTAFAVEARRGGATATATLQLLWQPPLGQYPALARVGALYPRWEGEGGQAEAWGSIPDISEFAGEIAEELQRRLEEIGADSNLIALLQRGIKVGDPGVAD